MKYKSIRSFILLLSVAIGLSFITIEAKANSKKATVTAETLNVRGGPSLAHAVEGQIYKNETYNVLEEKDDWIKLELKNNKTGWVASWLLSIKQIELPTEMNLFAESTVDWLRVRNGPGTNFQIIGHIFPKENYKVLEKGETWSKIQYNQSIAYTATQFLLITEQKNQENITPSKSLAVVTVDILNVRSGPSTTFDIIGKLNKDDSIKVLQIKDGWYEININNTTGWIAGDFVTVSETNPSQEKPKQNPKPTSSKAKVNVPILNVRDNYSLDGKVIGKLSQYEIVEVIEEKNNWSKIEINGEHGWIASWYLTKEKSNGTIENAPSVTILYNGTNIRKGPSTNTDVVERANQGDTFPIIDQNGLWYQVKLPNGNTAFVAGWIVSVGGNLPDITRAGLEQYLSGKTIVIDVGHGGRDDGTTGVGGTAEKVLILKTSLLLAEKLKAAGSKVILTRDNDYYLTLQKRVSLSHYYKADAFLSIHYNSSVIPSVNGIQTFYYSKSKDKKLADVIHDELIKSTGLKDRKNGFGDYYVLRENKQPAALLELGFLSNAKEEIAVTTPIFQEKVTTAIYNGLAQYFKNQ